MRYISLGLLGRWLCFQENFYSVFPQTPQRSLPIFRCELTKRSPATSVYFLLFPSLISFATLKKCVLKVTIALAGRFSWLESHLVLRGSQVRFLVRARAQGAGPTPGREQQEAADQCLPLINVSPSTPSLSLPSSL